MAMTKRQKAKLTAYIDKQDRAREPVFVGRDDLFELVKGNARAAAAGDAEGRTICLSGPPGVGKTAFLSELSRRAAPQMACIDVQPGDLRDPPLVLAEIATQIPKPWRPRASVLKRMFKGIEGLALSFAAGNAQVSASLAFRERAFAGQGGMPWGELARALRGAPDDAVICLIVDEAQSISASRGETGNEVLRTLHMGPPRSHSGPPVFALLAGLPNTPDVIAESISRLAVDNERIIPNLEESQSAAYVERVLNHFEASRRDPGRAPLSEWVVRESGDFPHHLRNAMSAVAEGMRDADSVTLAEMDGASVASALATRRRAYYEKRMKGGIGLVKPDLAKLLKEWRKGGRPHDRDAAVLALRAFIRDGLDSDQRNSLAEEGVKTGAQMFDRLVRNGVLIVDGESGAKCPIDSMLSWLESDGREHKLRSGFPALPHPPPRTAGIRFPSP